MTITRPPVGINDHGLLVVTPYDHHAEVEKAKIQINGTSIAPGAYEHRVTLVRNNHRVVEVMLGGATSFTSGGRSGAWAAGTQVSGAGNARWITGTGIYTYIASFSRLHGDTYLSGPVFGSGIAWRDLYLDGDEAVIEFYNTLGTNQALYAWGTLWAK